MLWKLLWLTLLPVGATLLLAALRAGEDLTDAESEWIIGLAFIAPALLAIGTLLWNWQNTACLFAVSPGCPRAFAGLAKYAILAANLFWLFLGAVLLSLNKIW